MRWTLLLDAIACVKGRGVGKGRHSYSSLIPGWRMTGSAYNAMDVFDSCESLVKGRGLGKGGQSHSLGY